MLRTNHVEFPVTCRQLSSVDYCGIVEHLLALDFSARYDRFGRITTDADIRAYATGLAERGGIRFGLFRGQALVGMLELLPLDRPWRRRAELAMTVSRDLPRRVFGGGLLRHAVRAARQLGFTHLLAAGVGSDLLLRDLIVELCCDTCLGQRADATKDVQWIEQHHGLEHAMTGQRDVTAVIALRNRDTAKTARKAVMAGS